MRYSIPANANWRDAIRRFTAGGEAIGAEGTWADPDRGAHLVIDVGDLLEGNAPSVPAIMRYTFDEDAAAGLKNLYIGLEDGITLSSLVEVQQVFVSATYGALNPGVLTSADSGVYVTPVPFTSAPSGSDYGPGALVAGYGNLTNWVDGVAASGAREGGFWGYRHPLSVPALSSTGSLQAITFSLDIPMQILPQPGTWSGVCVSLDLNAISAGETVTIGAICALTVPVGWGGSF